MYRKVFCNIINYHINNIIILIEIFFLQPIFLNELFFLGDSETNGNINLGFSEGTENSKILRLRDHKKPIILLAPTPSECSLWVKRIIEAKKKFMENEKSRLQKQRSSKLFILIIFKN